MSYITTTIWVDDDIIAESPSGLVRVVLRPDEDNELDGDYLPILVRRGHGRDLSEGCSGADWYYPNDAASGSDEDDFARAVDHFVYGYGWDRQGRPIRHEELLARWVRIFLGGTGVVQLSTPGAEFFACDSAALRKLWGTPPEVTYGSEDFSDEKTLRAFFDNEVYGYAVQTREDPEDEDGWEDTDDVVWGHIGREYAEEAAREALAFHEQNAKEN